MELEETFITNLISKKVYHPLYGEIGKIKDLVKHQGKKYVIFKERCMASLTEGQELLRAIPAHLLYLHKKSNQLRVNFGVHWITEAPKFTAQDFTRNVSQVLLELEDYYSNNTLWSGKIMWERLEKEG